MVNTAKKMRSTRESIGFARSPDSFATYGTRKLIKRTGALPNRLAEFRGGNRDKLAAVARVAIRLNAEEVSLPASSKSRLRMRRIHFIEIGDEPWCPTVIRRGVTDYCRFVTQVSGAFNPVAPLLAAALRKTAAQAIVDLGSGAGGPWLSLQPLLHKLGFDLPVCLSDHDPNLEAF